MYDLVIKDGMLVTTGGAFISDLAVQGAHIASIGHNLEGREEIDAQGLMVLPGGVDPHVHLEMPTATTRTSEDWSSGTLAAAYGGTTTVIDFVEPEGSQTLFEAFEQRRMQA
jgi:dihydropyrimidinase